MKTGSTGKAGFCLSATATRNKIHMIAVVMGCESSKARIKDARTLLDYGFQTASGYTAKLQERNRKDSSTKGSEIRSILAKKR